MGKFENLPILRNGIRSVSVLLRLTIPGSYLLDALDIQSICHFINFPGRNLAEFLARFCRIARLKKHPYSC